MKELWSGLTEKAMNDLKKKIEILGLNDIARIEAERRCLSSAYALFPSLFHVGINDNSDLVQEISNIGIKLVTSARKYGDEVVRAGLKPNPDWAMVISSVLDFWFNYAIGGPSNLLALSQNLKTSLANHALQKSQAPIYAGMAYAINLLSGLDLSDDLLEYRRSATNDAGRLFFHVGDRLKGNSGRSDDWQSVMNLIRGAPMNTGDGSVNMEDRAFAAFLYLSSKDKSICFFDVNAFIRIPFYPNARS